MTESPLESDTHRLLEQYPLPEELLALGKVRHRAWAHRVDCEPTAFWQRVSDTPRLNRALGLAAFTIDEDGDRVSGSGVIGGLRHEWIEHPWDWEIGRSLVASRFYRKGWLRGLRILMLFEPDQGKVAVSVLISWVGRGPLGTLVMGAAIAAMPARYRKAFAALAGQGREDPTFVVRPPPVPREIAGRLAEIRRRLGERVDPDLADQLVALVREGDDLDLDRVQPLRWARQWQRDRLEVVSAFLHATRQGLFELGWDVICPYCRGPRATLANLSEVSGSGACAVCHTDFRTDGDHSVEISFRIHPSIREVPDVAYCVAEAQRRHIKVQWAVAPGERWTIKPALGEGRYRMRLSGRGSARVYLNVGTTEADSPLELQASAEGELACSVQPTIRLSNDTDELQTFIIEDVDWSDDALTPAMLFSMQAFRDLFSEQFIESDIKLSVGRQTILFTDIVGSTRFYAERGDPAAFSAVRAHFDVISPVVVEYRGAVIKTIGDAVMAAFPSSVDAVAAAAEIHRALAAADTPITVRVSLHEGPCIAVNWNNGLDYFGSTVNVAAKLQACADAYEVAISDVVFQSPRVQDLLRERGAGCSEEVFDIKALDQSMSVHRWKVECEGSGGGSHHRVARGQS